MTHADALAAATILAADRQRPIEIWQPVGELQPGASRAITPDPLRCVLVDPAIEQTPRRWIWARVTIVRPVDEEVAIPVEPADRTPEEVATDALAGRQMDGSPASMKMLAEIIAAAVRADREARSERELARPVAIEAPADAKP